MVLSSRKYLVYPHLILNNRSTIPIRNPAVCPSFLNGFLEEDVELS